MGVVLGRQLSMSKGFVKYGKYIWFVGRTKEGSTML